MKNFTFLTKTIMFLFIALSYSLHAQKVIVDNLLGANGGTLNYQMNFNLDAYNKVSHENGREVYVMNETVVENNINDVALNVELIFDANRYFVSSILAFNVESGNVVMGSWGGTNPVTFNLPEGTYDIFTAFQDQQNNFSSLYVIKELISIQQNTSIQINIAEANNQIEINTHNQNGELFMPGIYNPEDGTINGGTASDMFSGVLFTFEPRELGLFANIYPWFMRYTEQEKPAWNYYINDVSNRYSISQFVFASNEGEFFTTKCKTLSGVSNSEILQNDTTDWVFHQEKFQPSIFGQNFGTYHPGISMLGEKGGGIGLRTWQESEIVDLQKGIKLYLNNPIDESKPGNILVSALLVENNVEPDPVYGEETFLYGNALTSTIDGDILYGSGGNTWTVGYHANQYYYVTEEGYSFLPLHPRFSFNRLENSETLQGNNVPVSVALTFLLPEINYHYTGLYYIGNYGEVRDSDYLATNVEIKRDGNSIFSGNYVAFSQFPVPLTGSFDYIFTNTNVSVEGIIGKNETKISYATGSGDTPPTIQRIQFRNAEDKVTNRYSSTDEGFVRIAAGDFQYNFNSDVLEYVEGNEVQFYYSQYNQNNWTELELTEYTEYFQMPAFGDYYEASLASIENTEENVWYDVKVICTDAAGNKQEQTISPAFKINDTMGTDEITKANFTVYPNPFSDNLNIQLPEHIKGNVTFRVTDLTGKTVYSKEQTNKSFTWNGSSLPKGVYILSIENNAKVIAKKVIKK